MINHRLLKAVIRETVRVRGKDITQQMAERRRLNIWRSAMSATGYMHASLAGGDKYPFRGRNY